MPAMESIGSTYFGGSDDSLSTTSEVVWIGLVRIQIDSGDEHAAIRDVSFPGRTYEGRILNWGRIDKSISTPSGMQQTADFRIRMADTDRKWRNLFSAQTPLYRPIQIKFARTDQDEGLYDPFMSGTISDFNFGPGWIEIEGRDDSWDYLDEEIKPLITRANYPDLAPETQEAFFPIWLGSVDDAVGLQGVAKLPHIGWTGAVDRYALSRTPVWDVAIYKKASGDPAFLAVDPADYDVTVATVTLGGKDYDVTYIDFLVEQAEGTEVSADCDGIAFRPEWFGFAAEGYDAALNPGGTPGVLENPIDCFISLMLLEFEKATKFDSVGIMAIHDLFDAFTPPFTCRGVITETITRRALLGRFLPCFNLDLFHNRNGELALNFTDATDPDRALFSDDREDGIRNLIVRESFNEQRMKPTTNQIEFSWYRNHLFDKWGYVSNQANAEDVDALAVPIRDAAGDKIPDGFGNYLRTYRYETSQLEMWFIRDSDTAVDVIDRRLHMMALGSFIQTFQLPLPEVLDDIELCRLIGITHVAGIDSGGYDNTEAKIIGMSLDLKTFRVALTTVLRVPQPMFAA